MAQQSWSVDASSAGFRTLVDVSKNVRHANQPNLKARQFVTIESAFGKGKGDTMDVYRVGNTAATGSTINELAKIPETTVAVTRRSMSVNEYGLAIPFTSKVQNLAEVDVDNVYVKALKNDQAKVLDKAVIDEMKNADLIYTPTSLTAGVWDEDGTPTTTALANITVAHIKIIVDAMKTGEFTTAIRPIPFFEGEHYICLASVKFMRGIKNDPDWEDIAKYANTLGAYTGEVGRLPFQNVRFVETNHINALSNGVGTSNVLGEAIFFGEDPIRELVSVPEEIREKIPDDYGRGHGVAWYALLGFGRVWDASTDSEDRIVRVASS